MIICLVLLTIEVDKQNTDSDSFQSTLSHELYEVLSALSHACQLINVIAFYLHIALPFRLHQLYVDMMLTSFTMLFICNL